jgi:ribosomal protein S5
VQVEILLYNSLYFYFLKGGQLAKYSALLATGNYNGVVGFARAKGPTAKIAIQRVSASFVFLK